MVFPVIHSTLDPRAINQEIDQRYILSGAARCQLISRANNDFYELTAGEERYALRVSKANFRTFDEYVFEAEYVNHLYTGGCVVPAPITAKDGSFFFEIEAPEGVRTITVMRWLEGETFDETLSKADAEEMGAALARLHDAGETFATKSHREISTVDILNERMPELITLLGDERDHAEFYEAATEKVLSAFAQIDQTALRHGPVHGDFQYANVMRTNGKAIAVLDFDTCGVGCIAEDIYTFVWRSDMEIRNEDINTSFLKGYEQVRPLLAHERDCGPLFRVARDLVMSSTYAILINRVGPVPGFDGDFAPFTELVRRHLGDANLV